MVKYKLIVIIRSRRIFRMHDYFKVDRSREFSIEHCVGISFSVSDET